MSQLAGADLEDFRHLVKLGHQATGPTVKPQLFAALHRVETDFSSQAGVLKHLTSVTASSAASQHEAASVSIHATLRCAGFKCVERGEGGDAPVPGFEPPKRVLDRDTLLPRGWNRQGDLFTFHYEHEEAQGAAFVLKCVQVGGTLSCHLAREDGSSRESLDVDIGHHIAAGDTGVWSTPQAASWLLRPFDLEDAVVRSLLRPLVPRAARQYPLASAFQVREEVSPTTAPASSAGAASAGAATTGPREAAARADPAYGRSGFEVDLGPTSGGFAPGMAPPPGAGSLVGPDHPLFHGRGGPPGPGWDGLPPGVPPGARFDPFGPGVPGPGVPGPGRGLPRGPRGPRGPRAPGFGPNPDHLRPPGPGYDDPFGGGSFM